MPIYFRKVLDHVGEFQEYDQKKILLRERFGREGIQFKEHADPKGIMFYNGGENRIYIEVWSSQELPQKKISDLEEIVEQVMGIGIEEHAIH